MSMMNWPDSLAARSLACSGVAASARDTPNSGPKVSFIARKAAAMPAGVWKKRRRLTPCFFASSRAELLHPRLELAFAAAIAAPA